MAAPSPPPAALKGAAPKPVTSGSLGTCFIDLAPWHEPAQKPVTSTDAPVHLFAFMAFIASAIEALPLAAIEVLPLAVLRAMHHRARGRGGPVPSRGQDTTGGRTAPASRLGLRAFPPRASNLESSVPAPWETGGGDAEASAMETETGRGGVAAPASDWVPASERGGGRQPQLHRRLLHLRCRRP